MATTHDISLTEEDIDQMFQTRFNQPHEKTIADIQAIYNKI